MKKKVCISCLLGFWIMLLLSGCNGLERVRSDQTVVEDLKATDKDISKQLTYESSMELLYAERFTVDYYQDEYALISVADGGRYLLVPEGEEVPQDLAKDIVVLKQPLNNIYLVASAVMDMFRELNAIDTIRFSGQKADGWCIEEAREEMEKGNILYSGKYNMPDYELIVSEGCSLAIENNMISHSPEVMEKLESFGIPVFVDFSSYESHPLGRVEWIKLYGVLLQEEETARYAFEEQVETMDCIVKDGSTGKKVAYFYITTNGMVSVRCSSDYIPKMIELAGGEYIFKDLGEEENNRSSLTMQVEEFYNKAKDVDYLIYNGTTDGGMKTIEELLAKEELLRDFKAVQEGNIWCTTKDLYQQSMAIGGMIEDIHNMLTGIEEMQNEMRYMYQLQ